jgi:hypothetical protein
VAVGLVATGLVFGNLGSWPVPNRTFWLRLLLACALTIISLTLRSLRWIFLLRRVEMRIPIRDAYIGYLAGLSLLVTPLFLGEIAVRAAINRSRGRVPVLTTAVVNLWERALDLVALSLIAGVAAVVAGREGMWKYVLIGGAATTLVSPVRRVVLRATTAVLERLTRAFEPTPAHTFDRLAAQHTWLAALATSVVAWLLPGLGFWRLAGVSGALGISTPSAPTPRRPRLGASHWRRAVCSWRGVRCSRFWARVEWQNRRRRWLCSEFVWPRPACRSRSASCSSCCIFGRPAPRVRRTSTTSPTRTTCRFPNRVVTRSWAARRT